jgi:hypothetical protein
MIIPKALIDVPTHLEPPAEVESSQVADPLTAFSHVAKEAVTSYLIPFTFYNLNTIVQTTQRPSWLGPTTLPFPPQ